MSAKNRSATLGVHLLEDRAVPTADLTSMLDHAMGSIPAVPSVSGLLSGLSLNANGGVGANSAINVTTKVSDNANSIFVGLGLGSLTANVDLSGGLRSATQIIADGSASASANGSGVSGGLDAGLGINTALSAAVHASAKASAILNALGANVAADATGNVGDNLGADLSAMAQFRANFSLVV